MYLSIVMKALKAKYPKMNIYYSYWMNDYFKPIINIELGTNCLSVVILREILLQVSLYCPHLALHLCQCAGYGQAECYS